MLEKFSRKRNRWTAVYLFMLRTEISQNEIRERKTDSFVTATATVTRCG